MPAVRSMVSQRVALVTPWADLQHIDREAIE